SLLDVLEARVEVPGLDLRGWRRGRTEGGRRRDLAPVISVTCCNGDPTASSPSTALTSDARFGPTSSAQLDWGRLAAKKRWVAPPAGAGAGGPRPAPSRDPGSPRIADSLAGPGETAPFAVPRRASGDQRPRRIARMVNTMSLKSRSPP